MARPKPINYMLTEKEYFPVMDWDNYKGQWFELARIRNWYERNDAFNITAFYTPDVDGKQVIVNNSQSHITVCGELKTSSKEGKGYVVDGKTNQLHVSFFEPLDIISKSANYIVHDYIEQLYSLVGSPHGDLWLLSRKPWLTTAQKMFILKRIELLKSFAIPELKLNTEVWQMTGQDPITDLDSPPHFDQLYYEAVEKLWTELLSTSTDETLTTINFSKVITSAIQKKFKGSNYPVVKSQFLKQLEDTRKLNENRFKIVNRY